MERLTISLPPELHRKLKQMAAERGISLAALVRETLDEHLARQTEPVQPKGKKRDLSFIGAFASGRADGSDLASKGLEGLPEWR